MKRLMLLALLASGPALAQDGAAGTPPKRVRAATVYGDDPCPKAQSEDEVVVCARRDESERYRIPSRFREQPSEDASARSWSDKVEGVMEANRAGLPNSCSPIGSGGQTGCNQQAIRRWFDERRAQRAADAAIP